MGIRLSRRGVFIGAGAVAATSLAPSSALAFDPATFGTAIKVAEFALGAARMLQGSSTTGASDLQVRLLINLSKQLAVVQDGVTLVLTRLEEIRSLLGEVPTAVVQELTTRNLQGKLATYHELLQTLDGMNQDHRRFRRERAAETNQLITDIRDLRQVLMSYRNYINIPVLSAALSVEYEAMRLMGETDERVIPVMRSYEAYFSDVLYAGEGSLKLRLEKLRQDRKALVSAGRQMRFIEAKQRHWGHGFWWVNIGYAALLTTPEMETYRAEIEPMLALGLIDASERPLSVATQMQTRLPSHVSWTADAMSNSGQFPGLRPTAGLPNYSDEVARIETERRALEDTLNVNVKQIYSAASCFYAGSRALNFCQQFHA